MNRTGERGGLLLRLAFLLLIGSLLWFLFSKEGKIIPRRFAGRLQTAVDQELSRQGVTDENVRSIVRREHSRWGFHWVETHRVIDLADAEALNRVAQGLARVASQQGCSFKRAGPRDAEQIRLNRFFLPFQTFELVTPAAGPVKGKGKPAPRVAFVIDDVAYTPVPMDHFASLGVPLTFSILPRERHSRQLSEKAASLHFPVMLHLPMEPIDLAHNDPGPSGLYLKMSEPQLKMQFDKDFASVPNIVGINNHMGSAFTENETKMAMVLPWVKRRGVYFLDSRTSLHSVVCRVARRVGVPCLANETFLDNEDDADAIERQLDLVMKLALRRGETIAIGHYRRKHLVEALARKLPEFRAHGVEVVALPAFFAKSAR